MLTVDSANGGLTTVHRSPVGESTAPPHRSCRVGAMERNQTQATDLVRSVHMEICDQPKISPRFTKGYTWCYQTISIVNINEKITPYVHRL